MSALFALLCSFYLTRPLTWLREAMGQVAQGRFDVRVRPRLGKRRDEIVDLAEDCDRMAGQLKALVQAQQNLLHDISHELRSPLTRMHAAIGLMRQQPDRPDMLERVERESRRMDDLIEQLLTLARAQSRQGNNDFASVDVVELLAQIVEDARFEAGMKQCQVSLLAQGAFLMHGHEELLYRAFENVIRNAVRYTKPGTAVLVEAAPAPGGQWLQVCVSDHGPGVDPARLQRIFEPFDRGTDSSDGFGLGLAIAQRAIALHGGSITALAAATGGLRVRIELPQAIAT